MVEFLGDYRLSHFLEGGEEPIWVSYYGCKDDVVVIANDVEDTHLLAFDSVKSFSTFVKDLNEFLEMLQETECNKIK